MSSIRTQEQMGRFTFLPSSFPLSYIHPNNNFLIFALIFPQSFCYLPVVTLRYCPFIFNGILPLPYCHLSRQLYLIFKCLSSIFPPSFPYSSRHLPIPSIELFPLANLPVIFPLIFPWSFHLPSHYLSSDLPVIFPLIFPSFFHLSSYGIPTYFAVIFPLIFSSSFPLSSCHISTNLPTGYHLKRTADLYGTSRTEKIMKHVKNGFIFVFTENGSHDCDPLKFCWSVPFMVSQ
jgi:hypothetical protein